MTKCAKYIFLKDGSTELCSTQSTPQSAPIFKLTCLLMENPTEMATKGNLWTNAWVNNTETFLPGVYLNYSCAGQELTHLYRWQEEDQDEDYSRMNKVGCSINWVDDPSGLICEDASLTCSHWLLPYEPGTKWFSSWESINIRQRHKYFIL